MIRDIYSSIGRTPEMSAISGMAATVSGTVVYNQWRDFAGVSVSTAGVIAAAASGLAFLALELYGKKLEERLRVRETQDQAIWDARLKEHSNSSTALRGAVAAAKESLALLRCELGRISDNSPLAIEDILKTGGFGNKGEYVPLLVAKYDRNYEK